MSIKGDGVVEVVEGEGTREGDGEVMDNVEKDK